MSNTYSAESEKKLLQCDRRLQEVFRQVLKVFDHTILDGHRDKDAQTKAFQTGHSKVNWPMGRHNALPSYAVDAVPYPVDFTDLPRIYYFAGYVMATAAMMGIKLRWGGDWDGDKNTKEERFLDLVHFEIAAES